MRFLSSDVALVFLLAELKVMREGLPPVLHACPTLVAKRTAGGWKNVAFQNTMVTEGGASAGYNRGLAQAITTALNGAIAEHHPIKGTAK